MLDHDYIMPWCERPKSRPMIRKPWLTVHRSSLGTTLVFRGAFSGKWLFNVSLAWGAI